MNTKENTDLLARISGGWTARTARPDQQRPVVRILSDADFDAQIDKRSSAYKSYPSDEAGTADYSNMHACILRFSEGPDELLIRESLLANSQAQERDSAS